MKQTIEQAAEQYAKDKNEWVFYDKEGFAYESYDVFKDAFKAGAEWAFEESEETARIITDNSKVNENLLAWKEKYSWRKCSKAYSPAVNDEVIFIIDDGRKFVSKFVYDTYLETYVFLAYNKDGYFDIDRVKAWMPIPTLEEEEK